VVAADDEVGAAVIPADDRVQEDLARPGHPHGHRQEAEDDRAGLVVVVDQGPIATDPGVMIDVAGLGDADDRVNQQAAADLLGRPLGQLLVGPVQGVPGLEGDDLGPAERLEMLAEFARGPAEVDEVEVRRDADHLEATGRVEVGLAVQVGDGRVLGVGRPVGSPGFLLDVVGEDLFDMEEGQEVAIDVAERQGLADLDAFARGDREGHGQGPERPVGQPLLGNHTLVIGLTHEALERREAADRQQFEVAEPSIVERQARVILGRGPHLGGPGISDHQLNQLAPVRGVQSGLGR
jgi:hypothetical protein